MSDESLERVDVYQRIKWIVGVGGLLALGIIGFYFSIPFAIESFGLQPFSPNNHLLATSIFSSFLLTFALIVVYREIGEFQSRQAELMDEQTRIQSNQERIMELQYEPILHLTAFETPEDHVLVIGIENIGKELAKDAQLVCHGRVAIDGSTFDLEEDSYIRGDGETARFRPFKTPLNLPDTQDLSKSTMRDGATIGLGDSVLVSTPMFWEAQDPDDESTGWRSVSIGRTVQVLDDLGAERVNLSFAMMYETVLGNKEVKKLRKLTLQFEEQENIEELDQLPGISMGKGGRPDSGEWTLEEVNIRSSRFDQVDLIPIVTEEEILEREKEGEYDIFQGMLPEDVEI